MRINVLDFTQAVDPMMFIRECERQGDPWLSIEFQKGVMNWWETTRQLNRAAKAAGLSVTYSKQKKAWFVQR